MSVSASRRLAGRLALITGASRGLGAALARRFAAEGAHVVLVARTVGGLEEVDDAIQAAGGEPATLLPLDLAELDKVDALGPALYQRFGRLDVLVCNAAVLKALSPVAYGDPGHWEPVLAVNLTANYRLIRTLHPLLRAGPAGRVIAVTCGVGHVPTAFWEAYAVSKAGLESLAGMYATETATEAVRVNLVDPGPMRTKLRATAYPGEDPGVRPDPATLTDAFVDLAAADCTDHGRRLALQPA
jgi:NAD(P)-dependent dehydrogenase (short-subunit alcohol dehydrogenase family)